MSARLVIFDLDYTLSRKGSWGFLVARWLKRHPSKILPTIFATVYRQARYKSGHDERLAVKTAMLRHAFAGCCKNELEAFAQTTAEIFVASYLRDDIVKILKCHQQDGDIVMLASASADVIVKPVAKLLNIPHLVSTHVEWDAHDKATGRFDGANCYNVGKLDKIKAYMDEHFAHSPHITHITAYSDSIADLPMLEFADRSIPVYPDVALKCLGLERHWIMITKS